MNRFLLLAIILCCCNACLTLLRGGRPDDSLWLRSEVGPVTAQVLGSGELIETCQIPCELQLRTAEGYVLYLSSPDAEPTSVLLWTENSSLFASSLLLNLPTLFLGTILDSLVGATYTLKHDHIVVRKYNGRLEAYVDADPSH